MKDIRTLSRGDRLRLKGYAWLFVAGAIAFGIGLTGLVTQLG